MTGSTPTATATASPTHGNRKMKLVLLSIPNGGGHDFYGQHPFYWLYALVTLALLIGIVVAVTTLARHLRDRDQP